MSAERTSDLPAAIEELQSLETPASVSDERLLRETGVDGCDLTRQPSNERAGEEGLEWLAHPARILSISRRWRPLGLAQNSHSQ